MGEGGLRLVLILIHFSLIYIYINIKDPPLIIKKS
jgi:hypothetical protein